MTTAEREKLIALVKEYQNGNEEAFTGIYKLIDPELRIHARAKFEGVSREVMEDQLQETYFSIIEKLGTLRTPENFRAWAKMILFHKFCDYFRCEKEQLGAIASDEDVEEASTAWRPGSVERSAEQTFLWEDTIKGIMEKLGRLSKEQAVALYAFACEGYSEMEVADLLGCKLNTAKSRIRLAREKMCRERNGLDFEYRQIS